MIPESTITEAVSMARSIGTGPRQIRVRLADSPDGWIATIQDIDLPARLADPFCLGPMDRRFAWRAATRMAETLRLELAQSIRASAEVAHVA